MSSEAEPTPSPRDGTIVVAIVIPSVLVIVLLILIIARAFVLPCVGFGQDDFAVIKEARMKQRLEDINGFVKAIVFSDWIAKQKKQQEKSETSLESSKPLCAICLDVFDEDAQVRDLRCGHVFHTHCLDEWFARFNEYCPLCHRPIIPGRKIAEKRTYERQQPLPLAYIV
ncbi:hypothetical protein IQ06DRAFT_293579 [Phaeosphaeriaceae sp. SRC1lsM3a]|nr:hypothetical protein IQ06DRAFT_293579 [Stagonospora sp. SRC1lsM3a]